MVIPDYLSKEDSNHQYRIVGDAKYMHLYGNHLPAERAQAIYYKTIMYMHRFKSKIGFLFHPIHSNEAYDDLLDLKILPEDNGHIFVLGLRIPNIEDIIQNNKKENGELNAVKGYSDFCEEMKKSESKFLENLNKIISDSQQ